MERATLPFAEWLPRIAENLPDWRALFDRPDPSDSADSPDPSGPPGYETPGHDRLEDLVRDLPERATFRQNLVLIFVRAQALAPSGRVTADSLAAALMVRDSYTGLWAFRYMLPLH